MNKTNDKNIGHAFRSGMSRGNDLRAAISAGVPVGVVAGELTTVLKILALPKYLVSGGAVFIDSGAFGELKTGESPDFDAVLHVYETVAEMADMDQGREADLYVVAPDKVGDQQASLERLAEYRDRVSELITIGCKVIVPIQRGDLSPMQMIRKVIDILGTSDFVAGIPSNAAAMSIAECASISHHAFHILGRVQKNDEQVNRIAALRANQAGASITADANWLRSRLAIVTKHANDLRATQGVPTILQASNRTAAVLKALTDDDRWAA